jgi:uncharacterized protein with WD repeat
MEMFSKKFATKIREVFAAKNRLTVLATIPNKIPTGPLASLIESIKKETNSKVIEVSKSNRDDILQEIISTLTEKQHEKSINPANPGDKVKSAEKDASTTCESEKDKKIRKVNDKLSQIAKLKQQVKEGKQLEVNQLEKIKKESEFLAELKQLRS